MKVTFVNHTGETFSPTAAGAAISMWLWEMCLAAQRAGVRPLVVTRQRDAQPYDWKETAFVPFPAPPANPLLNFALRAERKLTGWRYLRQRTYVRRVAAAIRTNGMEEGLVVLHNDPEMAIHLRKLLPSACIVLLFHNSNHYMRRTFRGDLVLSTNLILAVSDAAGRAVEEAYQIPAGTVKTLYNGVDVERFRPRASPEGEVPVVNFTGRIRYEKAPDLLLRAALIVSESTRGFSLQLLGQSELAHGQVDKYELEIRALISALELRGIAVRQAGYVDRLHVADEVRKGHIHVTPSRKQEEFGLATIEAMASGLATVASRTGGTPEVVGDAGLLFESEAVGELAAHLKTLIVDRDLRALYAQQARHRAEGFTWDKTWSRLVQISVATPA